MCAHPHEVVAGENPPPPIFLKCPKAIELVPWSDGVAVLDQDFLLCLGETEAAQRRDGYRDQAPGLLGWAAI